MSTPGFQIIDLRYAGLFDESIQLRPLLTVPSIRSLRAALLATTPFLRELLSDHTLLSDHALL